MRPAGGCPPEASSASTMSVEAPSEDVDLGQPVLRAVEEERAQY